VIPQLLIFLSVVAVLSFFVFKPALKILDGRRNKTSELEKDTENLLAQSEAMDSEYDGKINEARIEGSKVERDLIAAGEEEARSIINKAKQKSRDAVSKTHDEIAGESVQTKKDLSNRIDDFAKMIVSKVLGKNG